MIPLGLRSSVRLLTILPLPWDAREASYAPSRATAWYPLVGLAIGGCLYPVMMLPFAQLPRAAICLIAWVAISGGLHEDALIDSADAGFASGDADRRNRIRKDPHIGAFGATASALSLIARFAALAAVSAPAVLLAPVVGRCSMALSLRLFAPHATSALGGAPPRPAATAFATCITAVIVIAIAVWQRAPGFALAAGAALLGGLAASAWLTSRMGGASGDVHGAAGVIVETMTLYCCLGT